MAPRHGQPPLGGHRLPGEVELGLAWPHGLRGTCPLSSCHSVWTKIPQKGRPRERAQHYIDFQNWFGTEFLGEVAGYGKRAEARAKGSREPRGTWVSLTLCPQATVVQGLAVSWHAYLPAFQSPCHGARVPGLGQVAELLGRSGWVESFLSGSPRRRSVGELSVPREAGGHCSKLHSG